jgi:cell division protein FtsL
MVQTSTARKLDYENHGYSTGQEQAVRKVRRVYKKSNPRKTMMVKAGVAIFVYAIVVVYLCIKISTMGYEIVRLEKDIENLHAANHMLEFKIAETISLDKVEMLATSQLGMCKADRSKAIAVVAQKPEPIKLAGKQSAGDKQPEQKQKLGEKSLQKLYTNLMLLAEKK